MQACVQTHPLLSNAVRAVHALVVCREGGLVSDLPLVQPIHSQQRWRQAEGTSTGRVEAAGRRASVSWGSGSRGAPHLWMGSTPGLGCIRNKGGAKPAQGHSSKTTVVFHQGSSLS